MTCRVCGRALDDCGTCVCASQRRAGAFDAFLADCVADCVGPAAPDACPGDADVPEEPER